MSDPTLDKKIMFATTVLSIMRKRLDFDARIMTAHRDIVSRSSAEDPFVSECNLSIVLNDVGNTVLTEPQREALLTLLEATLHDWYKLTPEFKSWIAKEFLLSARLRGDDEFAALVALDGITDSARSYGNVQSERQARLKADGQRRQQERDAREFERAKAARERDTRYGLNAT